MSETEISPRSTMIIEPGTMINLSGHEDDEPLIAEKELKAVILPKEKQTMPNAVAVIIPEVEPDQVFYIHQPEK